MRVSGQHYMSSTRSKLMSYRDKHILLASKHKKENVIAPIIKQIVGAYIDVAPDFDTDVFGTFTGEIPRSASPKETVINKARTAIKQYGYHYAIASEGSFNPHPYNPFASINTELVAFVDNVNQLSIIEHYTTAETNFMHFDLKSENEPLDFLQHMMFPSHAVIVSAIDANLIISKGVTDINSLRNSIKNGFELSKTVRVQTDMRAMHNPTRMKSIEIATQKLAMRITTSCPKCDKLGYGEISYRGKLPCKMCSSETEQYLNIVHSCIHCDYYQTLPRHDNLTSADPANCPYCNP